MGLYDLSTYLDQAEDADMIAEIMGGCVARCVTVDAYAEWLMSLAPWQYFLTLTVRPAQDFIFGRAYDKPAEWSEEAAKSAVRRLVREQNKRVFGSHFKRVIKQDSYFSYAFFTESQKWGAIHLHGLETGPVDMAAIHEIWKHGYAWVVRIEDGASRVNICRYLAKYVGKGGVLADAYRAEPCDLEPSPVPYWWVLDRRSEIQLTLYGSTP